MDAQNQDDPSLNNDAAHDLISGAFYFIMVQKE